MGDVLKLLLEPREVGAAYRGSFRRSDTCRGCGGRGRRGLLGGSVERALPRSDLGDHLIDVSLVWFRPWRRRGSRRRRLRGRRAWTARGHLIEACVELGDGIGEACAARRQRCGLCLRGVTKSLREFAEAGAERAGTLLAHARDRRIAEGRPQPILDRHTGAVGGFTRRLVKLRTKTPGIPRYT